MTQPSTLPLGAEIQPFRKPEDPPPDWAPSSWNRTVETHLLDHVRVLYKRRATVASIFVAVVLIGLVYAFTRTPIYEARARLLIELDDPNVVQFQPVMDETRFSYLTEYYETQYQLLESRSLARRTLDELDLWSDPVFLGVAPEKSFSLTRAASRAIGSVAALAAEALRLVLPGPPQLESSTWDPEEGTGADSHAIDIFLASFSARPVEDSRLVDIGYRSPHPRLASTILNAHAEAFIAQSLDLRFVSSKDANDWLSARLEEQRQVVEDSEEALHRYRLEHDAISFEDREDIVVQRLAELNAAHTRARTELIVKESVYRQVEATTDDPAALDAIPAVMSNRVIQDIRAEVADLRRRQAELSENLGPRHPDMIAVRSAIDVAETRLRQEIAKVVESVRNEYVAAETQERRLAAELTAQKNEALAMNEVGIEYNVLAREAESNRQIYQSLLIRAKETGIATELRNSNIRVVDRAEVPSTPISPRRSLILMVALLTGTLGGVGMAFFFEYLDSRVKTPRDMQTQLGLPSLGLIPALSRQELAASGAPLINAGVSPKFVEAFRSVRSSVLFSAVDDRRSFVITSTGPGEGKSVVASNLAIGLAQTHQAVLLIDGDMRCPTLHSTFDLDQEPGLSNLLVGDATSKAALRKTSLPGLWLLPAGRIPPNPAELLGSERFKALLSSLTDQFDWILVDSPPVMAVTDASLIAHTAGGVIFVVGADMTSRHVARQALDQLEAANGRFVGGVLNRVDLERNPYYYSHYYRNEYQRYYVQPGGMSESDRRRRAVRI